jgi:hypothetical protein
MFVLCYMRCRSSCLFCWYWLNCWPSLCTNVHCKPSFHYHNFCHVSKHNQGPLWLLSYGSWIYNYLCNQCLSLLMSRSSTNKTDCHNITEILLKVSLNIIKQAQPHFIKSNVLVCISLFEWFNCQKCVECELVWLVTEYIAYNLIMCW